MDRCKYAYVTGSTSPINNHGNYHVCVCYVCVYNFSIYVYMYCVHWYLILFTNNELMMCIFFAGGINDAYLASSYCFHIMQC
uniref:Uncharacterized protein n=1 Tax=Triticum urartu TaxID=4572 RepID=A0A8R7UHE9_TRIUA